MTYTNYSNTALPAQQGANSVLLNKVMMWLTAQMIVAGLSMSFLGPLVPQPAVLALLVGAVIFSIVISMLRKIARKIMPLFALILPSILGISLYGMVNHYISTGNADVVIVSFVATGVIFLTLSIKAWFGKNSIEHLSSYMYATLFGLIVLGLLNLWLQVTLLTFIFSLVAVILFSLFIYLDMQRIKNSNRADVATAAEFALELFLDLFNLLVNIMQLLGMAKD